MYLLKTPVINVRFVDIFNSKVLPCKRKMSHVQAMPYHPQKRYLSYCAGKFFPFIYRMNGCWEMDTTGFEPVTDCLWDNCSSTELSVLRYQVPSPNFPWHCCGSYPHSHNKGSAAYFIAMFITGEVFRGFWHPFNQPRWARRRRKLNEWKKPVMPLQ